MNEPVIHQAVPSDLLCLRCRYALKGASREAVCPECALPVAESLTRPGLTNAPVDVLQRLRYWASSLAWSSSLLSLLSIALFFAVLHSLTNLFGTPGRLFVWMMNTLPPAMLVAAIALGVAAVRTTAALRDAGLCPLYTVRVVLAGYLLFATGWGMSITEQYMDTSVFGYWLMGALIWCGGALFCFYWSRTQLAAARAVAAAPRRWLAMIQLALGGVLTLAGGVVVLGPYVALAYLPLSYSIYYVSQNAIPYLVLAVMLLTAANAFALSVSTRRLLRARFAA